MFDAKLENERLKWERDNAGDGSGLERLAGVLEQVAPAIVAKLTGAPVPAPTSRGTALVNGVSGTDGLGAAELENMLAHVVTFAKRNPEQARQYIAALAQANEQSNADDTGTN